MFIANPMKLCVYGVLSLVALMPRLALAQQPAESFAVLGSILRIGDAVRVTDSSGKTTQGRITGVSTSSLSVTVDGREQILPETTIQKVTRRRPDPWWNGALIGAAVGAVVGAVVAKQNCGSTDCGEGGLVTPGFTLIGAGIGAGAGALVDRFISRFDTVFAGPPPASVRSVRLSPVLSKGTKGLQLSVTF